MLMAPYTSLPFSFSHPSLSLCRRVIEGTEVLESLNKIKTFDNERPQEHCIISDCGKLTVKVV